MSPSPTAPVRCLPWPVTGTVSNPLRWDRLRRAYGGLGEILAVVTPLMWGHLFSISQQPPAWLPRLLRWGKAGHCALAAVLYVLCWRALHHADDSTLFIDDDDDDEEQGEEEKEE